MISQVRRSLKSPPRDWDATDRKIILIILKIMQIISTLEACISFSNVGGFSIYTKGAISQLDNSSRMSTNHIDSCPYLARKLHLLTNLKIEYNKKLRGPVDEEVELAIDENRGMKNYIASEEVGITTSAGHVRKLFSESIRLGRQFARNGNKDDLYEALRLLGTGCHCLEDFSAHSNYTEVRIPNPPLLL